MSTHADPAHAQDRARKIEALGRVPREIFDLLAASLTPLKAYDLLWRLQEKRGRRAPPSTIYRAVAVLIDAGLIHKVESLNAFVMCAGGAAAHQPVFLVCERCGGATEIDGEAPLERVMQHVAQTGFRVRHLNFVVRGVCARCQTAG